MLSWIVIKVFGKVVKYHHPKNWRKKLKYDRKNKAIEVFTQKSRMKYDQLPEYQRLLISRLIDHGNFEKALEESNAPENIKAKSLDPELVPLKYQLPTHGIDAKKILDTIKESMEAEKGFLTGPKDNKILEMVPDHSSRLKAVEIALKIRGEFKLAAKDMDEDDFVELFGHIPEVQNESTEV
ncbi:MAG: hypothetical protein IH948_08805 [Bacteroidetes bacterium]|nr:hypothetical protein [Bacteroidota bacterium]